MTKQWSSSSSSVNDQNEDTDCNDMKEKFRLEYQISKVSFEGGHTNPLKDHLSVEIKSEI